ncbi:hypothetical protein [Succinatimonas hippei]|nr:hypothetical protein [Succinatimonas hippei]
MAVSDSVSPRSVRQTAIIGMAIAAAMNVLTKHAVAAAKVSARLGN